MHGSRSGAKRARPRSWAGLIAPILLVALSPPGPALAASSEEMPVAYHRAWFERVEPIASPEEVRLFRRLPDDGKAHQSFAAAFWRSRRGADGAEDPGILWARRVRAVSEQGLDPRDGRAAAMIRMGIPTFAATLGHPDHRHPCGLLVPLEIFYYGSTAGAERGYLVFVQRRPGGSFSRWRPEEGVRSLVGARSDPRTERIRHLSLDEGVGEALRTMTEDGCEHLGSTERAMLLASLEPSASSLEGARPDHLLSDGSWVDGFETTSGSRARTDPGGTVSLRPLASSRDRTLVEVEVDLPEGDLPETDASASADAETDHERGPQFRPVVLAVDLWNEDTFLTFAQTLWLPRGTVAPSGTITVAGSAPPGTYLAVVRLLDVAREPWIAWERVSVPGPETQPSSSAASSLPELRSLELRLPPGPHLGTVPVLAEVVGAGISSVRFSLDGRQVALDRDAPFSVDLELGDGPTGSTLEAVALDRRSKVLARDAVRLDAGAQRVRLELVSSPSGSSPLVEARLRTPPGVRVERIVFFVDGQPLTATHAPPWIVRVSAKDGAPRVVRAEAALSDGRLVEDALLVGAEGVSDEVEVSVGTLFFSAYTGRNRPVRDLRLDDLALHRDGRPVELLDLSSGPDLPLAVVLLADASSTMREELPLARTAALTFFEGALGEEDRASFLVFNHHLELVVPFTDDLRWLREASTSQRAYGGTALHDSLVHAVHYSAGLAARTALIVLTDGIDDGSWLSSQTALEAIRRSGVAVYPVLLQGPVERPGRIPGDFRPGRGDLARTRARKLLHRVAEAGGGLFFAARSPSDLERILGRIESDLRSQYRLTYRDDAPSAPSGAPELSTHRRGVDLRWSGSGE